MNLPNLVAEELKQKEMDCIKGGMQAQADGCNDRDNKCKGNATESVNVVLQDLKNHIINL